jgi:hypothetical protein
MMGRSLFGKNWKTHYQRKERKLKLLKKGFSDKKMSLDDYYSRLYPNVYKP